MIEHYKVITFTHHQVNVSELGNYQVTPSKDLDVVSKLKNIKAKLDIEELIYLSTCNRVSYILYTKAEVEEKFIFKLIKMANDSISEQALLKVSNDVSLYEGTEAIQHIFEVASSVDSLVIGESEIFHQFRTAYNDALENKMVGDNLRLLENSTVQIAKNIYSHTRINEKPLSIAALAGQALIQNEYNPKSKVVLIGAGETNTLVAKFLFKHKFTDINIYNRSIEKANQLAELVQGKAMSLNDIKQLDTFDVIIACTASQNLIVTQELYASIVKNDTTKKVLIDLSVPANIDKKITEDYDALYISIDDLKTLADKNLHFRKQEISIAKVIIEEAVIDFEKLYAKRQIELALADLPIEIKKVKDKIINQVFKEKIDSFEPEQREVLDEILAYMEAKCIGIPMKLAKKTVG
jgi:glutamyl-tRNA reductase